MGGEPAVHRLHVFGDGPVGGEPAQRGLPRVQMGIDQPGRHDHAGSVDDLRVGGRGKRGRDRRDAIVLDEDIALRQIADLPVHGDDASALDQGAAHVWPLLHALTYRVVIPDGDPGLKPGEPIRDP